MRSSYLDRQNYGKTEIETEIQLRKGLHHHPSSVLSFYYH